MDCQHRNTEAVTTGHCNAHGEPDYQITAVTEYCRDCGAVVSQQTYDSRD